MIKINTLKMSGEKGVETGLNPEIFDIKMNDDLIYQAIVTKLSNARSGNAHAKDRSEVRGGGKKPWKQKGTGNARAGSSRSPLWIGGGATFGPRNTRNWHKKLTKKMRQKAIFMALTDAVKNKKLLLLDKITFSSIKTKNANEFLEKMPIKEGSVLVIISASDANIELSFRNLPYVKVINANSINVYDILKFDWIIVSVDSITEIEKIYLLKDKKLPENITKPAENKSYSKKPDKSDTEVKIDKKVETVKKEK